MENLGLKEGMGHMYMICTILKTYVHMYTQSYYCSAISAAEYGHGMDGGSLLRVCDSVIFSCLELPPQSVKQMI